MSRHGGNSLLSGISDMLSFEGDSTAVGLSIGTSSVKLVELKKAKKVWKLLHFGVVQLPEDTLINHEIINPIAVVEAIKTLLNQVKLKSKQVCTSVCGNSVIIKKMTLNVPNPKELEEQVFWEAEQYIPYDPAEVVMDYHVVSRSKDNNVNVILVAVKTSVLDSYMGCIADAGLKPKIVDVDYFALQHVMAANYPTNQSESIAVVDIGAVSMKVLISQDGVPIFTKESGIGGKSLTSAIQRHLGLSYVDAETLKIGGQAGGMPQEVSELMAAMTENIGTEIKKTLDFYSASSAGAPVSYVLLSGGGAYIPDLSRAVEEITEKPTQIINPFNAISYDPAVFTGDYISAISGIAAVPIGLAMRAGAKK